MQCTSLISAMTVLLLSRHILSHLLGIGREVEAIEHINEYFNNGCVVSLDGLLD